MASSRQKGIHAGPALRGWRRRVRAPGLAVLVAVVVAAALWLPGSAAANKGAAAAGRFKGRYVAGQLLVRFAPGVSPGSINARLGARTIRTYHIVPNLQLVS